VRRRRRHTVCFASPFACEPRSACEPGSACEARLACVPCLSCRGTAARLAWSAAAAVVSSSSGQQQQWSAAAQLQHSEPLGASGHKIATSKQSCTGMSSDSRSGELRDSSERAEQQMCGVRVWSAEVSRERATSRLPMPRRGREKVAMHAGGRALLKMSYERRQNQGSSRC